jgi:hypothetical protein
MGHYRSTKPLHGNTAHALQLGLAGDGHAGSLRQFGVRPLRPRLLTGDRASLLFLPSALGQWVPYV